MYLLVVNRKKRHVEQVEERVGAGTMEHVVVSIVDREVLHLQDTVLVVPVYIGMGVVVKHLKVLKMRAAEVAVVLGPVLRAIVHHRGSQLLHHPLFQIRLKSLHRHLLHHHNFRLLWQINPLFQPWKFFYDICLFPLFPESIKLSCIKLK